MGLQTQHTGSAIWFPTNPTDFIFAGFLASLAFQHVPLLGGATYPEGTQTVVCKSSEQCHREPEESRIQTGRGSGLAATVHVHSQMETDRMTPLPACLRSSGTKSSLQRNECVLPACLLPSEPPSTASVTAACPPEGSWGPALASHALLFLV